MNGVRPLVVFDFDGTLVDSRQAVACTIDAALASQGRHGVPPEQAIALIGLPLTEMFRRLVPHALSADEVAALVAAYSGSYLALASKHERLYDGIFDLLADLARAGRRLGVATSKSTRGAHAGAQRWGLQIFMERIYGFDAVANPKPAPDLLVRIMAELDVSPAQTVMVGDTSFDIEVGRRAGVQTVGVTWGAHTADQLLDADHVVHAVADLRRVLRL